MEEFLARTSFLVGLLYTHLIAGELLETDCSVSAAGEDPLVRGDKLDTQLFSHRNELRVVCTEIVSDCNLEDFLAIRLKLGRIQKDVRSPP